LGFRVPPTAEYSVQSFENAAEVQREIKQMKNISTAIISINTHCGASSSSTTTAVMQSSESSSDTTKRGTLRFL
jgi:alcohol dehydrogenase class IV